MPSVQACTLQRVQGTTTVDENGFRSYTLFYDVRTDGVVGHGTLLNQAVSASPHPLPTYGATYSYQGDSDGDSYAQNFSVESKFEQESQLYYTVTVNYSPLNGRDPTDFEPDPFDRGAVVWADRETYMRIIEADKFGDSIVNKCGRPYPNDIEEEDFHGVLVIEFNVATLGEVINYQQFLRRATNSSTWTILGVNVPARTAAAREVTSGPPIIEGAYTYYRMTFRFVFAEDGETWDVQKLEQGYQYFREAEGFPGVPELDDDGNALLFPFDESGNIPITEPEPVKLDEDGFKLEDGGAEVYTAWRVKREVDFNTLPF